MTDAAPATRPAPDRAPSAGEALSVVVVPLVGGAALEACVAALAHAGAQWVLVVASGPCPPVPDVTCIVARPGSSVADRRMIGLRAAATPLVAFLEDTCLPEPGWGAALRAAFAAPDVLVAGGPVRIARSLPPRLKALAIGEYARFAAAHDVEATEIDALAGANFAVRRAAFARAPMPHGLVDNLVFDEARRSGGRVVFHRLARVAYVAGPPQQTRLSARFHHGRIYGGLVAAERPLAARLPLAVGALAAPAVLIGRNLRDAGPELLRSPPTLLWTVLMHCAWGCGEVVGKLTGRVGRSFEAWV